MAQKPSIPKGTRDFSPLEMTRRTYMFDAIKRVFKAYGYAPLETPAMENLSTLMGKYGEEGDKLLFKILNSGDFTRGLSADDLKALSANASNTEVAESEKTAERAEISTNTLAGKLCEKGLRYDLTVPFARYVVQHQSEITFPFRRYQVQPVWRADRPQKGRYREFYQCDVDVIGSKSLLCEFELVKIVERIFGDLGINVTLKLNNRKILFGIAEAIGHADKMMDITIAIDKLDKTGLENVEEELEGKGITREAIAKLRPILQLSGTNAEKLECMKEVIARSETGLKGIAEMEEILSYVGITGTNLDIELDLSLARGLNYYTGAIFEVKSKDYAIGSICGGGRYDDLTGIFGMSDMSGVGISFGADRIYDVMLALNLFPEEANVTTKVFFVNFGQAEERAALPLLQQLRDAGISSEIYPESVKMKRQMEYANKRNIPFVVIIGETELENRAATLKDMRNGEQHTIPFAELTEYMLQAAY